MPYCHLAVGSAVSPQLRRFLANYLTALIADLLNKRREVTAIRIEDCPPGQWFIGGDPLGDTCVPAHATLYITAGTNSAAEKATFISQLDGLLRDTFGDLPEASYVVIHEVAASDWGYAGQTQAARRLAVAARTAVASG